VLITVYKGWTTPEVVLIYLFVIVDKKNKKKTNFLGFYLINGRCFSNLKQGQKWGWEYIYIHAYLYPINARIPRQNQDEFRQYIGWVQLPSALPVSDLTHILI